MSRQELLLLGWAAAHQRARERTRRLPLARCAAHEAKEASEQQVVAGRAQVATRVKLHVAAPTVWTA